MNSCVSVQTVSTAETMAPKILPMIGKYTAQVRRVQSETCSQAVTWNPKKPGGILPRKFSRTLSPLLFTILCFWCLSFTVTALLTTQHREEQLSFAEIVTLHQDLVYRYLLRFTRNVPDAQDLFQETFLRAHRAYAALPADADVRAWLMRIAINLTKNYVRDRQRRRRVILEPMAEDDEDATREPRADTDTEGLMMSREMARMLQTAIAALPFHQRVAFTQRQFEGLEYAAIATYLGCSSESARAHVYQALRKLRLVVDGADARD